MKSLSINIRNLILQDLPKMLIAENESWEEKLRASEETMKERIGRYPAGNMGIFNNESLMGMSVWQPIGILKNTWYENVSRENFSIEGKEAYVINFSVVHDAQGKGYAQILMHATLLSMKENSIKTLYLGGRGIPSNKKFYEKFFGEGKIIEKYWEDDEESGGRGIMYRKQL